MKHIRIPLLSHLHKFVFCVILFILSNISLAQPVSFRESMELTCELLETNEQFLSSTMTRTRSACNTTNQSFKGEITILSFDGSVALPLEATDFNNTMVWFFDHFSDQRFELVILFTHSEDSWRAALYDLHSNLGNVEVVSQQQLITWLDQSNPTVIVEAKQPWLINNLPNYNLEIYIDGSIFTIFGGSSKLAPYLETDGKIDYKINVADSDQDGKPDYEIRLAVMDEVLERIFLQAGLSVQRTVFMFNSEDNEPPLDTWVTWPWLGPITYGFLTNTNFPINFPPIQIDWELGYITIVGEIVRSRGNDNQWFVYSFTELLLDEPNVLDFEAPFAFYNLSQNRDGFTDLAIRVTYAPSHARYVYEGRLPEPVTGIRYTWTQKSNESWTRYKLGLSGGQQPQESIFIGDYNLLFHAKYEKLPSWVTSQPWDFITFVEDTSPVSRKNKQPLVGEGIYIWDSGEVNGNKLPMKYAKGLESDTEKIKEEFRVGEVGFRAEYALKPQKKIILYLSPVDRQLHLFNAPEGVWQIDEEYLVRYKDTDSDGYIDQWQWFERKELTPSKSVSSLEIIYEEVLKQELTFSKGMLLFKDFQNNKAVIKNLKHNIPYLFETTPPANYQEWHALKDLLSTYNADLSEFKSLKYYLEQAEGQSITLESSHIEMWIPLPKGLLVVMNLPPNFNMNTEFPFVQGRNVYFYQDSIWHMEFAQKPQIQGQVKASGNPKMLEPINLNLILNNNSTTPLLSPAELFIGSNKIYEWTELTILPKSLKSSLQKTFKWVPTLSGTLPISLVLNNEVIKLGTLEVDPSPRVSTLEAWQISNGGIGWISALLGSGFVLLMALLTFNFVNFEWERPEVK